MLLIDSEILKDDTLRAVVPGEREDEEPLQATV